MNIGTHGGTCGHSCCLRIQNLSVNIGKEQILKDISMHVHCSEIVAIIGPNGAGKSTLLKSILGQQDHEGVISFSVPGQRNRQAKIGYVPQSPTFDPGDPITVADLFACCMSKRPAFLGVSGSMKNRILECLSRVQGESLIHKRVGTLSGGELQRVLLALALEPLPNVLILDEPLSGVDVDGMVFGQIDCYLMKVCDSPPGCIHGIWNSFFIIRCHNQYRQRIHKRFRAKIFSHNPFSFF